MNTPSRNSRCRSPRSGFTLLEVILAIAILTISLAAIGEIVFSAFGNSKEATDSLEARMVAQSIIDEIKCGAREVLDAGPEQVAGVQGALEPALGQWAFQIITEPTVTDELLQVRVLVGRTLDGSEKTSCELVRWFPNPAYAAAATTATTTP